MCQTRDIIAKSRYRLAGEAGGCFVSQGVHLERAGRSARGHVVVMLPREFAATVSCTIYVYQGRLVDMARNVDA